MRSQAIDVAAHPSGAPDGRLLAGVRPSVLIAAALSLGAALVHFQVMPVHFWEWWGYGVFFLLSGIGQTLYAGALIRWPNATVAAIGIAGNLLIVGTYVWSRTNGIPWGPHAGRAEGVGIGDLTTTAGELALVAILVGMLGARASRWTMTALMLMGAALWSARLTGTLL